MTYQEINKLIESIGLPYAYYQFEDNTSIAPPFVVFFYDYSDVYADDSNYAEKVVLNIELYTDYKDIEKEKAVEKILRDAGLSWDKESARIPSERMWQTAYTTEVYINAEE
jgi:hypothetical protein